MDTAPCSGSSSPASSRSSVDLPAPFAPTRPTTSPGPTTRSSSVNRARAPWPAARPVAFSTALMTAPTVADRGDGGRAPAAVVKLGVPVRRDPRCAVWRQSIPARSAGSRSRPGWEPAPWARSTWRARPVVGRWRSSWCTPGWPTTRPSGSASAGRSPRPGGSAGSGPRPWSTPIPMLRRPGWPPSSSPGRPWWRRCASPGRCRSRRCAGSPPGWPKPWPRSTRPAWCTAMSNRRTSCWPRMARG